MRWGLRKSSSNVNRRVDNCAQCQQKLFRLETLNRAPDDPEIMRICPACNNWVHGECYLQHMANHIPGLLCLGVRKRMQEKVRATQGEPGQDSSAQGMYRWSIGGNGLELVEPAPVVPVV